MPLWHSLLLIEGVAEGLTDTLTDGVALALLNGVEEGLAHPEGLLERVTEAEVLGLRDAERVMVPVEEALVQRVGDSALLPVPLLHCVALREAVREPELQALPEGLPVADAQALEEADALGETLEEALRCAVLLPPVLGLGLADSVEEVQRVPLPEGVALGHREGVTLPLGQAVTEALAVAVREALAQREAVRVTE